jgi:2-dehydro-3-deoxyglucarate aldolase/4-hydroxy-2-oxoheptanedioate aldolase
MSGLRERVRAGETVRGAMIFEVFTAGLPRMLALSGAEYVVYDMEHAAASYETLKWQAAACVGTGVVPMARVPRSDYHFVSRALDVGMQGVMVPMVESREEAEALAEAMRYPPEGRRGAAFGFAHDGYAPGAPADKAAEANARNVLIAQIETERGLEAVEEIAAVPGVDVLWVGHFDLTNFLGIPGRFDHPEYRGAVARIGAAAKAHGKGFGILGGDAASLRAAKAQGFNMLAAGTDMAMLIAGMTAALEGAR